MYIHLVVRWDVHWPNGYLICTLTSCLFDMYPHLMVIWYVRTCAPLWMLRCSFWLRILCSRHWCCWWWRRSKYSACQFLSRLLFNLLPPLPLSSPSFFFSMTIPLLTLLTRLSLFLFHFLPHSQCISLVVTFLMALSSGLRVSSSFVDMVFSSSSSSSSLSFFFFSW